MIRRSYKSALNWFTGHLSVSEGCARLYLRKRHRVRAQESALLPLARYYDRIYWSKDYSGEVDFLVRLFDRSGVTGKNLLEVGCGTGNHTKLLVARGYRVTAVDISDDVLRVARGKVGGERGFCGAT